MGDPRKMFLVRCSAGEGGAVAVDAHGGIGGGGSNGRHIGNGRCVFGRDWSCLPEPALYLVLKGLVPAFADLFSFGEVCSRWWSVFRACKRELFSSLPPLLFCHELCPYAIGGFYSLTERRSFPRKRPFKWPYESAYVKGFSHGHWVVIVCGRNYAFIMDPFAGSPATRTDLPRSPLAATIRRPLMTAPPTSPDCVVVFPCGSLIHYCRPGDAEWTTYDFGADGKNIDHGLSFSSLQAAILEGKLYVMSENGKLLIMELLFPQPSFTVLEVGGFPLSYGRFPLLCATLTESNGEILCFMEDIDYDSQVDYSKPVYKLGFKGSKRITYQKKHRINVFRLDLPARQWVKLDSLGGRTVFLNKIGPALTCDATKWSGTRDCVYSWCIFSLTLHVFHVTEGTVEHHPIPEGYINSQWLIPSFCYQ